MKNNQCQAESGAVQENCAESAENGKRKKADDRQRVYAGIIYPESARPDWKERFEATHTKGIISPLHDKDLNPDGSLKKPHYHWMQAFEGKKSHDQLVRMWENIAGSDVSKHFEDIGSVIGYARYMIHLDNPEKAQYDKAQVRCFGGWDYDALIETTQDRKEMFRAMGRYILDNEITNLADFARACLESNVEWFDAMTIGRSYFVDNLIKAIERNRRDKFFVDQVGERLARLEGVCGIMPMGSRREV